MKKRILTMLLAVCFIVPCMFLLAACGNVDVVGKTFKFDSIEITAPEGTAQSDIDAIKNEMLGEDGADTEMFTMKFTETTVESAGATLYWKYADEAKTKIAVYDNEEMTGEPTTEVTIDGNKLVSEMTFMPGWSYKLTLKQA